MTTLQKDNDLCKAKENDTKIGGISTRKVIEDRYKRELPDENTEENIKRHWEWYEHNKSHSDRDVCRLRVQLFRGDNFVDEDVSADIVNLRAKCDILQVFGPLSCCYTTGSD